MNLKFVFILLLYFALPDFVCSQSIKSMKGLESITIYEKTVKTNTYVYLKDSKELNRKLSHPLRSNHNDFVGDPSREFYDVYYSDKDGKFNSKGKYITIETRYDRSHSGGGCNIIGVKLDFTNGQSIFANDLLSFHRNGENYNKASEKKAVDGDMNTWTSLGNTRNSSKYLRLTVGLKYDVAQRSEASNCSKMTKR